MLFAVLVDSEIEDVLFKFDAADSDRVFGVRRDYGNGEGLMEKRIKQLNLRRDVSVMSLARGDAEALSSVLGAAFGEDIGGSQWSWQEDSSETCSARGLTTLHLNFTTRYGTTKLVISHEPALCTHCGDPIPCCEKVRARGG